MSTAGRSAIGLVFLGGCDLYFGSSHSPPDARPDAIPDVAVDSPMVFDDAPTGPENSPMLTPPPGAPCTAPLPASSYVPPQSCALDGSVVPTLVNTNHVRDALTAQWLKCSGAPFGTTDEVGLEFTHDYHWYKLYLDGTGGVMRGQGFDHEGTYELLYVVDHVQMNINIAGRGTIYNFPEFTTNPVKFRVNNMGNVGDYIRNDDTGACLPPP